MCNSRSRYIVITHLYVICNSVIRINYNNVVIFVFSFVSRSVAAVKINANPPGANEENIIIDCDQWTVVALWRVAPRIIITIPLYVTNNNIIYYILHFWKQSCY